MNRKKLLKIILVTIYCISIIVFISIFNFKHEQVHYQIAEYFDIPSEMEMCLFGLCGGVVEMNMTGVPIETDRMVMGLQAVNEIVYYQYAMLLSMMFLILFMNVLIVAMIV